MMEPCQAFQLALAFRPEHHNHEQQEEASEAHHHTERPINERHIRHQFVRRIDVAVTEIVHIRIQHLARFGRLGRVRILQCAILLECLQRLLAPGNLLVGREVCHPLMVGVSLLQVLDARHISVDVVRSQNGEHTRHFHTRHNGERSLRSALLKSLSSSHFHRLVFRHQHTRTVTAEHHDASAQNAHHGRHTDAGQGKLHVALLDEIPRADAYHEDGSRHPSARHGVEELHDGHRVGHQCPEVHHLMAHGVRIERHAHRVLHPSVGNENPHGRDARSDARHPGGEEVCTLAYLVPSEEHDGEEGRFHEEGQNALDGQRSAEDVAHKPRIVAPVGTELKLEDDARSDAHGKVDGEELHPELGSPFPELVFLNHIQGFHGGHNHGQPQGEGHEDPMVTGGKGELCPRPVD